MDPGMVVVCGTVTAFAQSLKDAATSVVGEGDLFYLAVIQNGYDTATSNRPSPNRAGISFFVDEDAAGNFTDTELRTHVTAAIMRLFQRNLACMRPINRWQVAYTLEGVDKKVFIAN
jgi:hypothetical protein